MCVPDFTDCQFDQPSTFRDAVFQDAYPILEGAMLHPKTVFTAEAAHWPKGTTQDAKQVRDSCAALRHVMTQQGLPEDAHFFFRREMAAAEQIGGFWQRLPYHLFGWLSDYGASIQRPLIGLAACWGVPALIYLWVFAKAQTVHYPLDVIGRAMGFSFVSLFKFFGFQRLYFDADFWQDMHWTLKVLSAGQTIAGIALLFFLGLGLRQRFRLR